MADLHELSYVLVFRWRWGSGRQCAAPASTQLLNTGPFATWLFNQSLKLVTVRIFTPQTWADTTGLGLSLPWKCQFISISLNFTVSHFEKSSTGIGLSNTWGVYIYYMLKYIHIFSYRFLVSTQNSMHHTQYLACVFWKEKKNWKAHFEGIYRTWNIYMKDLRGEWEWGMGLKPYNKINEVRDLMWHDEHLPRSTTLESFSHLYLRYKGVGSEVHWRNFRAKCDTCTCACHTANQWWESVLLAHAYLPPCLAWRKHSEHVSRIYEWVSESTEPW